MRRKNKGKIHPSPSSSPAPSPSPASRGGDDVVSVLNVLPSAILALALVLPLEDREVLAYMITRSVEVSTAATDPASVANTPTGRKKAFKKPGGGGGGGAAHRPPLFHCHCFDCYTAYWLRWDSSASRELIHQAIEAFEDHLDRAERPARGGNLRREKWSHPGSVRGRPETPVQESPPFAEGKDRASLSEMNDQEEEEEEEEEDDVVVVELSEELQLEQAAAEAGKETHGDAEVMAAAVTVRGGGGGGDRRGLVSKLLPNVAGLLNFRRWKLWNPSE